MQGIPATQSPNSAAVAAAYSAAYAGQLPQTLGGIPPQPTLIAAPGAAVAIFEDLCQKQLWGAPSYQLLTTQGPDGRQLYVYKVSIPALANLYPHQPYFQVKSLYVYSVHLSPWFIQQKT